MKYMSILLSLLLTITCFGTKINAKSNEEDSDHGIENIRIKYENGFNTPISNKNENFTIYYESSGGRFRADKVDNAVYVLDLNSNKLVGHAELSSNKVTTETFNIMPRGAFSSWYFFGQDSAEITWGNELTYQALQGIVLTTLKVSGYIGIAASAALSIAAKIWNSKASNMVVKYYHSSYSTCGILIKEKAETVTNGSVIDTSGPSEPKWYGDPYDYTQPSGCREIVGSYPY